MFCLKRVECCCVFFLKHNTLATLLCPEEAEHDSVLWFLYMLLEKANQSWQLSLILE